MSEAYQLHACGPMRALVGTRRIVSKRIFAKRHWAEAYIDTFKRLCCDPADFSAIDPDGIEVEVVPLEIVESVDELPVHDMV